VVAGTLEAVAAAAAPDFLGELVRESQSPRQGVLAERARWLRGLTVEGREELLFEFEVLLRGVERGFHPGGGTGAGGGRAEGGEGGRPLLQRDFREELSDVLEALDGALALSRRLVDPDSDQKAVFRRFVERQLTDDRARRLLLEEELAQETPQESLVLLRESFRALRGLLSHLLQLPQLPHALYADVGALATREILLNRYFRPFRPLEFRAEYDRIPSVALLERLRALPAGDRRLMGVALLALFRALRSLEAVPPATPRRARVVLAVVRSELTSLVGFLTGEGLSGAEDRRLKAAAVRCARALVREGEQAAPGAAGVPEVAAEALREGLEGQVLALAAALGWGPEAGREGTGAFGALTSEVARAERLRVDLWVMSALCRAASQRLRGEPAADDGHRALEALRRFLVDFQDVGFQLLRFGDMPAFDRAAALVHEPMEPPDGEARRERMAEDCVRLGQTAESTFTAVSRRAQLRAASFDRAAAEALRDQYLAPAR
jgi:hypothetical protein